MAVTRSQAELWPSKSQSTHSNWAPIPVPDKQSIHFSPPTHRASIAHLLYNSENCFVTYTTFTIVTRLGMKEKFQPLLPPFWKRAVIPHHRVLPELTHVRFIVTAADLIHSFACPALGIKCDAYPGRRMMY